MSWAARLRQQWKKRERIYILPSGRGFLFLLVVLVIVVVGATYNNNLIFVLAFLLFSLFVVAMIETHIGLRGIEIKFISAEEAFAGDPLALLLQVSQPGRRYPRVLELRTARRIWSAGEPTRVRLAAQEVSQPARLRARAQLRGLYQVPALIVETFYPLGLFRAWKVYRPEGEMIVYPRPTGLRVLSPVPSVSGEDAIGMKNNAEGDFGELRPHRDGDSFHQVAWKHYARTGFLLSRIHWGEQHKHFRIPWEPQGVDLEVYLSQMSRWVQIALETGASFEMNLPRHAIEAGEGLEQAQTCWRALARYREGA